MTTTLPAGAPWTNWVGNQTCSPRHYARPADEAETVSLVQRAVADGVPIRVHATGHSFTPVCLTDGLLLDLEQLSGIVEIDADRQRATALAGTSIAAFGEPLWNAGLALRNQGDIDTQRIGGAVGTGTHGSGVSLTSFSGAVRSLRVVTGTGEVVDIDESDPDLLHAAQVSVGMLGVALRIEVQAEPAYRLVERVDHWSYEQAMEEWDDRIAGHRHFSMFWCPTERSPGLYDLAMDPAKSSADACYVKIYDVAAEDVPDSAEDRHRVDRSYRIYPMGEFEKNFDELEYFVRLDRAKEAIGAMRELMLASQPDGVFPLEIRTVAADDGLLSSQYRTPTVVLSVSGRTGTDYDAYLRSVDRLLGEFDARVHWGKLHYLTRDQLLARYPRAEDFIAIRRRFDPHGIFLNDHLRPLFA